MIDSGEMFAAVTQVVPLTVRIPKAVDMLGISRSKLYEFIQTVEIETIR
jgi:predicted DNA-binding transcriptional regulator AlpA